MADFVMVRLPGELAERIKALGEKREPFVRRAVEAALSEAKGPSVLEQAGPGPVGSSEPVRPAASPQASAVVKQAVAGPSWHDHAMDRQRRLNEGKYGQ